jgi:hypothetical protein
VAAPAPAHARSQQSSDSKPLPLSALRAAAAGYGILNYKSGKYLQPAGVSTANGLSFITCRTHYLPNCSLLAGPLTANRLPDTQTHSRPA